MVSNLDQRFIKSFLFDGSFHFDLGVFKLEQKNNRKKNQKNQKNQKIIAAKMLGRKMCNIIRSKDTAPNTGTSSSIFKHRQASTSIVKHH